MRRWAIALVATTAAVPVVIVGLLAMHATPVVPHLHAVHVMSGDSGAIAVDANHATADAAAPHGSGHAGHDLATCVWILVGGIALVIALSPFSVRIPTAPTFRRRFAFAVATRAPPMSARLSLVGLLRR